MNKNTVKNKRVITIQDISCIGQCSLTVALPIISACGVETIILPSAVLSSHTGGFTGYTVRDLTKDIPGIVNHWESEGLKFDCLYSGYLGSREQIGYVMDMRKRILNDGAFFIADPAMADNGRLYYGFDEVFAESMADLCGTADIILPNITEAAFMTGMEYIEEGHSEAYIMELLEKLAAKGAGKIILKGIRYEKDKLGIAIYDSASKNVRYHFTELIPVKFHGTGDCFASAFTGAVMQGKSDIEAVEIAAAFVSECITKTMDDPGHWYGVKFEQALPYLSEKLNRAAE